ncbi:hypothetical protein B0H21DRAFT_97817 [Amylocystis lapponica]|nr:hypothetical protein B0H21DRAFT_97817 [Amylocystis lapponica]
MLLNLKHATLLCSLLPVIGNTFAAPTLQSATLLPPSPFDFSERGTKLPQPQTDTPQTRVLTSATLGQFDYYLTENRHDPMSRAPRGRRQLDGTSLDLGSSVKFVPVLRTPTRSNRGLSARRSGRSKSQKLKDLEFGTTGNFPSGAFTQGGVQREHGPPLTGCRGCSCHLPIRTTRLESVSLHVF